MKKMFFILTAVCVFSLEAVISFKPIGSTSTHYQSVPQKRKLFKAVGCSYFNDMEIQDPQSLQNPYVTEYYKNNMQHVMSLSKKYGHDVRARVLAPMYLQYISDTIGYGVFATKLIKKDQFIGVYAGTLRATRFDDKDFAEDVDYAWSYVVPNNSDKKMIIDGKYKGNELRFINHDSDPNVQCITVVVDGVYYMCYIALKDIPAHTQLTVSYGDGYWFSRDVNPSEIISK